MQIRDLQDTKATLEETNTTLIRDNRELESIQTVLRNTIEGLVQTRQTLESDKSRIEGEIEASKEKQVDLASSIVDLEDEQARFIESYTISKEQMTTELARLELKRDGVAQEILRDQESQRITSEQLASMQMALDKRDENIRIREARVKQQESLIIRNSNLLNL